MVTARIAVLPMYDFPPLREAHDELWAALRQRLVAAGVERVPLQLSHVTDHVASWLHPELLLGQACEYPLAVRIAGQVRMVATPRYTAEGCTGACYRSAIIVRTADPAGTLLDLRGRRCAYNEADSNSGMNLLRAAIAPLARGARLIDQSLDALGRCRLGGIQDRPLTTLQVLPTTPFDALSADTSAICVSRLIRSRQIELPHDALLIFEL